MSDDIRLAFIGAGQVNFGGGEGPWNHAARFEQIDGVACAAVADVDLGRAERAILQQQKGPSPQPWARSQAFESWQKMADEVRPDAVVIGLPPVHHGRSQGAGAVEVELAQRSISMLIEKPISTADPAEVARVAGELARHNVIVSVAYMFRYARWARLMRSHLGPGGPNVVLARYNCAYSPINKAEWWHTDKAGGPIIEQATHFIDLARYIGGDVDPQSVRVVKIAAGDERGRLSDVPSGPDGRSIEHDVPPDKRIDRATIAHWRYENGAIGSLCHAVQLHGRRYEAEFEAYSDGVRCVMRKPYDPAGEFEVRTIGENEGEVIMIEGDDPYANEDAAFIDAVRSGSADEIESTYQDALRTYELSWWIANG